MAGLLVSCHSGQTLFPLLCPFPVVKNTQLICVETRIVQSFQGPGRLGGQAGSMPSSLPRPRALPERHSGLRWRPGAPFARPEHQGHDKVLPVEWGPRNERQAS